MGPQKYAVGRLDQLRGHAKIIPVRENTAREDSVYLSLFGNHFHVEFRGGKSGRHHGGAHDQRIDRREGVGDGIRQANRQEIG
jgi:hypothetical protein